MGSHMMKGVEICPSKFFFFFLSFDRWMKMFEFEALPMGYINDLLVLYFPVIPLPSFCINW